MKEFFAPVPPGSQLFCRNNIIQNLYLKKTLIVEGTGRVLKIKQPFVAGIACIEVDIFFRYNPK
jgi:hypothetical protein